MNKLGRIVIKTLCWMVGVTVALVLLVWLLIRVPAVQNFLLAQVTNYLEKKVETPFRIGRIDMDLPKKIILENIYVEDRRGDTLLAGNRLGVDLNLFQLFHNIVEIKHIDLDGIHAHVNRLAPEGTFNFAYILDAFMNPNQAPKDTESPLVINIEQIDLKQFHLLYRDEVLGLDTELALQRFSTKIEKFDLSGTMHFAVPQIEIRGLYGRLDQWNPAMPEANHIPESQSSLLPNIELKRVNLSQILFSYRNESMPLDTRFELQELSALFRNLDLNEQRVELEHLRLNRSKSHVIFERQEQTRTELVQTALEEPARELEVSTGNGWTIDVGELQIGASDFTYRDDNLPRTKGFDYGNIRITGLSGDLRDFYYSADSLSGNLRALRAKDGSGFEIRELRSRFSYTSSGAELEDLIARTEHSLLREHIKIAYPSLEALLANPSLMEIQATIRKSHLGVEDVYYFLPELDTIAAMRSLRPHTFHVHGSVKGALGDLHIPNLEIQTLEHTRLAARARLRGLPEVNNMHMELDLEELRSGKTDLDRLLSRDLLPDSVTFPEQMRLSGNFHGGLKGFEANLALETSDGGLGFDGHFRTENESGRPDTSYSGQLRVAGIDVGGLLGMRDRLGKVSLDAQVEGQGLDPKTMRLQTQMEIGQLEILGYDYRHLAMEGSAAEGRFALVASSRDSNIDFDLSAESDMRGAYPTLNLSLNVDSINFKNLKLMDDQLRYHGQLSAEFSSANIDFLNGELRIQNSSIAYNDERYTLSPIRLLAESEEGRNLLQLTSEFLNAHLVGDYKLSELPDAIQDIVAVYYQPDSVAATRTYSPQQFDFSAQFSRSRFIRDFLPELSEMQPVLLDGSFNSEDKFLLAKLTAPRVVYAGTRVQDVNLDISTVDSTLYYSALIKQIGVGNVDLINTLLSGTVVQNELDFGLWIKDEKDQERYHLGMDLSVDAGNFVFHLKEDGLMLNYDTWDVNPENFIAFGHQGILAHQFDLSQNGQSLSARSQDSLGNSPLDLVFSNFRIETFSKLLESEVLNMGGGINGRATVSRLDAQPLFVSDLEISRFYFGRDTIGDVQVQVHNEHENTFSANVQIQGEGNDVQLKGDLIAPPGENSRLDFVLDMRTLDMKTVQAFSLGYLRNSSGSLGGNLKITGTTETPEINGAFEFRNATLNIALLNATILADQQRVTFDRQGIRFNRFEFKDSRNNTARLDGSINTRNYSDFAFNLSLSTSDFQLLNSTVQDNDLFYGQLYLSSNMRITGTLENPIVNGNVRVDENTDVTFVLPNDDPGMVERDGIIKFVDRSDSTHVNIFARLDSLRSTEISGLRLSMNVQTDESAAFTIVIDPGTEDALRVRGSADLSAGIDPSGDITLTGTYKVNDGTYSFTFEPVKRVFNFKEGSTITWTGDPMDARLDITAVYKLRAPTLELVQNQVGGNTGLYKQRVPFDVNLRITGAMLKPDLKFNIDLDEENALISQDVVTKVSTALNQLEENESEMNKQVFALIVLGRFMASNPFESLSGGGVESMARSSVSSLLSAQLNRLASDLIKGVDLDFDLQSENDYTTGNMQTRTDLNIGVSKLLFDDRLKVTIGSNFELEGQARPGEQTTNIAGDISVDYQLSKDGRYLARVYRKNQYQVTLQGQFVETGIGFIINLDYDEFKDLFQRTTEQADLFSPDAPSFDQRFDRQRMETDSIYRDSVRQIIRDSLQREDPELFKRLQERRQQREREEALKSSNPQSSTGRPRKQDASLPERRERRMSHG